MSVIPEHSLIDLITEFNVFNVNLIKSPKHISIYAPKIQNSTPIYFKY